MAYKVLYRKYRPDSFEKIVGQRTITETLKNSIQKGTFAHAYIFTGPRGTGKTSTAKVLAKAINCENTNNGEACGKCDCCTNFQTSPDIIEIDAASNNGVDEIRELRTNITLAPNSSKYKIYIIDEVHMLSTGAFNALLKTLEEPPAHVIFILATTEVYKVPITILSRCQRFDFKKIDEKDMINHLKWICKEENIEYDDKALEEIYSLSEGCLRDALGILDQTSKSNSKITEESIIEEYNIISEKNIDTLINDCFCGKIQETVEKIKNYEDSGMNAQKMLKRIIKYLEKIAINIKLKTENRFSFIKIKKLIDELNQIYIDARINENVYTMIKLAFLDTIEEKSEIKEVKKETKMEKNYEKPLTMTEIRINNCFVDANKNELSKITEIWNNIDRDKLADMDLREFKPVAASPTNSIFITDEESLSDLFNMKSETIEKLLKKNGIETKVVAIPEIKWQEEKEKYKMNLSQKKKYEYIEEKELTNNSNIKKDIDEIFTENLVELA